MGSDTVLQGTETPYRKTPPTNMGSVAEKAATGTPPTADGVAQAGAAAASAPVNTIAPLVTGTPTVAMVLTCDPGTWPGAESYTYQWFQYPDTPIADEVTSTYTLAVGDVGQKIFCRVTGIDSTVGGYSPVNSNAVGPVAAA